VARSWTHFDSLLVRLGGGGLDYLLICRFDSTHSVGTEVTWNLGRQFRACFLHLLVSAQFTFVWSRSRSDMYYGAIMTKLTRQMTPGPCSSICYTTSSQGARFPDGFNR